MKIHDFPEIRKIGFSRSGVLGNHTVRPQLVVINCSAAVRNGIARYGPAAEPAGEDFRGRGRRGGGRPPPPPPPTHITPLAGLCGPRPPPLLKHFKRLKRLGRPSCPGRPSGSEPCTQQSRTRLMKHRKRARWHVCFIRTRRKPYNFRQTLDLGTPSRCTVMRSEEVWQ